jgi:hypothetical protein
MKEAAEVTGSILFLIASWAFRVVWGIIKIALFFAIFWGAVKSLSNTSIPVIGDIINWAKTANPSFFGSIFLSWVAENWMSFAILLIFLNSVFSRWVLEELSKTGGYTRIFIATLMNYLGVETETPSMKKMRKAGMWAVMKEGLTETVLIKILGVELPDDRLSAKAVRFGEEVHLSDDVKEAMGSETDKREKDESW